MQSKMLSEGVKLYFDLGGAPSDDRIHFSHGSEPAPAGYKKGGRLPKMPWRSPSEEELRVLLAQQEDSSLAYHYKVALSKVPDSLAAVFDAFDFKNATNNNDARQKIASNQQMAPLLDKELKSYVDQFLREQRNMRVLGIFALENNQLSVAAEKTTMLPLGLHFDDSIGFSISEIEGKPGRVSFNLGRQPRYLYFINLHLSTILEMARQEGFEAKDEYELAEFFFDRHPDYPIIRLTIHPGEAYFAPTDHILHDGSTLGIMEDKDVSFVVLGYFHPF
jgi:hypothetical protein